MKKMQVQAMIPAKGDKAQIGPATIEVDWPENLEEAKSMFGEEAILSNAFANWRVTLQAGIRTALRSGLDESAIQAKYADAKLGVAMAKTAVDPQAMFLARFKSATPEQQAQMLAELKAMAGGGPAPAKGKK